MIRSQEMRATSGKERDDSEVMKVPTERERERGVQYRGYLPVANR